MGTKVLEDGPFRIEWNGGHTFNVFALDREVNVFSSDYSETLTEVSARDHAQEWWTGKEWEKGSGKEATQEVIRNEMG
ncbi:MAG TPA: hypothetical protein VFX53_05105 [Pedococcus sp.]|nr:hypothetical protein [Pedococcus sp.]